MQVVVAPTAEEEAGFVAREVRSLLADGRAPRDIAVLYRASNLSKHFEEALRVAEVPVRVVGGSQFGNQHLRIESVERRLVALHD